MITSAPNAADVALAEAPERPYPGTVTGARILEAILGPHLPIAVRAYDGSRLGPADAPATLLIRSPKVFRRPITTPPGARTGVVA